MVRLVGDIKAVGLLLRHYLEIQLCGSCGQFRQGFYIALGAFCQADDWCVIFRNDQREVEIVVLDGRQAGALIFGMEFALL